MSEKHCWVLGCRDEYILVEKYVSSDKITDVREKTVPWHRKSSLCHLEFTWEFSQMVWVLTWKDRKLPPMCLRRQNLNLNIAFLGNLIDYYGKIFLWSEMSIQEASYSITGMIQVLLEDSLLGRIRKSFPKSVGEGISSSLISFWLRESLIKNGVLVFQN